MPLYKLKLPAGEGWSELVDAWGKLLGDYARLVEPEKDVAYWHNEQTITALLATAAWQTGGAGLVEGATHRVRLLPEQSGSGAVDAWLKIGKHWYSLEAKLCWIADETKACVTAARSDLEALPADDRADCGIAVCYCVPATKGKMRDARRGDDDLGGDGLPAGGSAEDPQGVAAAPEEEPPQPRPGGGGAPDGRGEPEHHHAGGDGRRLDVRPVPAAAARLPPDHGGRQRRQRTEPQRSRGGEPFPSKFVSQRDMAAGQPAPAPPEPQGARAPLVIDGQEYVEGGA